MAVDIGPKIGIDGEKEFRDSINNLSQQVKTFGAELKAVDADRFSSSEEKAAQKSDILKQSIEAQRQKVDELKKGLAESTEKYGEADSRTLKWRQSVAEAQAQLNSMEGQLDDTTKATKESTAEVEKSDGKWKDFAKTLAAGVAAAAAAAGAAALKLGKAVVEAYADTEQLRGGVETLFKDAAGTVQANAEQAFKTVGLSANEYMETVTGFSAALISSMGGDTAAAAEKADLALRDMSDNANKMGSDMESIKNAYSGFAKGQYTMLDNLKLGYGGTKTEMERLLKDAEAISGVRYDIDSYADVIDAIHVIQTEMDITGTTAKEAESTISGSLGMLKKSFQNLIAGLGDPEANVAELSRNVTSALKSVITNIMPVIQNISAVLPEALRTLMTSISGMLPILIQTATELLTQVINSLVEALPMLIPVVVMSVQTIATALLDNLPLIIDAGIQLVTALGEGLITMLPELAEAAVELVTSLAGYIVENGPEMLRSGLESAGSLVEGILEGLPDMIDGASELIDGFLGQILDALPDILDTGAEVLAKIVQGIVDNFPDIVTSAGEMIAKFIGEIATHLPEILESGVKLLGEIIKGLIKTIPELILAIPQIIKAIVDTFKGYDWLEIGRNIIEGLKNGLINSIENVKKAVQTVCSSIGEKFKSFFGIASPSKWARDVIGGNIMAGVGKGFEKSSTMAMNAAEKAAGRIGSAFENGIPSMGNGTAYAYGKLSEQLGGLQIVLDDGTLVGKLSPAIDKTIGGYQIQKGRYWT